MAHELTRDWLRGLVFKLGRAEDALARQGDALEEPTTFMQSYEYLVKQWRIAYDEVQAALDQIANAGIPVGIRSRR